MSETGEGGKPRPEDRISPITPEVKRAEEYRKQIERWYYPVKQEGAVPAETIEIPAEVLDTLEGEVRQFTELISGASDEKIVKDEYIVDTMSLPTATHDRMGRGKLQKLATKTRKALLPYGYGVTRVNKTQTTPAGYYPTRLDQEEVRQKLEKREEEPYECPTGEKVIGGLARIYRALEGTSDENAYTMVEIGRKLFPDLDEKRAVGRVNNYLQSASAFGVSDKTGIIVYSMPIREYSKERKYYSKLKEASTK